jgi:hypothetical protein
MRATSPVLICSATKDFFDIGGTWDTFRYAKRLYTRMGFAERVGLMENDAGHNYNTLQREAVARWMSRWLLGKNQAISEPTIQLLSEQEYRCTADGKVMSLPGARSAYDLNEDYENELAKRRTASWAGGDGEARFAEVRWLAGVRKLAALPKPAVELLGAVARPGYKIEKLLIKPEPGVLLPALRFVPGKPQASPTVLYVHERGKAADAGPGGPIEQLLNAGQTVLAVDLRGMGETQAPASGGGYSAEFQDAYLAYLLGRSYVGMRAEDVLVAARYAAEQAAGGQGKVCLVALGNAGVPALHAAALEPALFENVKIRGMLASWSSVIHGRLNKGLVTHLVHGALVHYDLPDLAASLGNKITIEQPADPLGVVVGALRQL